VKEIVMSNDEREGGPLRHFRIGRRAVLQSLATGVGVSVLGSQASAHVHGAAAAAKPAEVAATGQASSSLLFLDQHAFDTLALLSEQIVPGSRATRVPEYLDRLLSVEKLETQKRFMQAIGAFEREAREAHGKPWKALTPAESTALLTKISTTPESETIRQVFDGFKDAIAESYYSTEPGMKELGWDGTFAFVPPAACG
jgi:hypothetical protein